MGISLPQEIVSEIDIERGDIPRSRYILRILQQIYCSPAKNVDTNMPTRAKQAPKESSLEEARRND
jgi:hypothetical protein